MSAKEYIYGRRRRPKISDGNRTALYLRVSNAEQKPDLQYDGLRTYAARAGLQIVRDYCGTGVAGRREGRPQLNALMTAARNRETAQTRGKHLGRLSIPKRVIGEIEALALTTALSIR